MKTSASRDEIPPNQPNKVGVTSQYFYIISTTSCAIFGFSNSTVAMETPYELLHVLSSIQNNDQLLELLLMNSDAYPISTTIAIEQCEPN